MAADVDLLQYTSLRPGSRLLIQEEAAAPVFWVTLEAIIQERSPIGPIERFSLRALSRGLRDPSHISGFLGVDRAVLDRTLIDLWQNDLVDLVSDPQLGRAAVLTSRGREAAASASTLRTKVEEIEIAFDRLTWKVSSLPYPRLLRPRDVRSYGLRQIDPAVGRQPTIKDLSLDAVRRALEDRGTLSANPEARERELIALRAVRGMVQMYRPVDLLAYAPQAAGDKALDPSEIEVAIGEAGHISKQHSMAFAGTPQYLRYARELAEPVDAAAADLPADVLAEAAPLGEIMVLQGRLADAESRLHTTERHAADSDGGEMLGGTTPTEELRRERDELLERLNSIDVRQLQTWELAQVLRDARYKTRRRLLIISPWITREVVDQDFVQSLGRLASNGVRIHIGYGFPGNDGKDDSRALKDLNLLVDRAGGKVTIRKLGTTHEKVLIFDDTVVTASFNWLSFKGDPKRPLRRESGTLVRKPGFADSQYESYVAVVEGR